MDAVKLAYFAGLIDGEGHIGCQIYSGAKRPVIQLQMTCKETVQAFCNFFGTKLRELNSPSHQEGYAKGYKQMYHTRAECHIAYKIIKALQPFLITKVSAAAEACSYYEDRPACPKCGQPIPVTRTKHAVYCSSTCQRANKRKGSQ